MKKISFLSLLTLISLSFFSCGQSKKKFFLENRINLPDSFIKMALSQVTKFDALWGMTHDTMIIENMEKLPGYDGREVGTVACTRGNIIYFRGWFIRKTNLTLFKNVFKHELFHTLAGPNKLFSGQSYRFITKHDTIFLKGFQGLNVFFDKKGVVYSNFEEAAAEYVSYCIDQEHSFGAYDNLGYFMGEMVKAKWITPLDLVKSTKESDIYYFCSKILNKDKAKITHVDIKSLMEYFLLADSSNDTDIFNALKNISDQRAKNK